MNSLMGVAIRSIFHGMLAEQFRAGQKVLNRVLHADSCYVLAVIAIEVMPRVLGNPAVSGMVISV